MPTISICIPTYRGAAHLRATIDSVLAQTYRDFELIVIDDNSPDDTAAIVESYTDERVRYVRNSANLGPEGNWNRCREEARGKYFKLVPQDDLLAPGCVAEQVEILEGDTGSRLALTFGARDIIDSSGRKVMRLAGFGSQARVVAAERMISACTHAGTNLIGEPANVLMRRALVDEIGPFDGTHGYMIDLDYWFRALRHGDAYYSPRLMSSFRISAPSWSVAIGRDQSKQFRGFIERYARTPGYRISRFDLAIGVTRARLNARMRQWIYRWLLRRAR